MSKRKISKSEVSSQNIIQSTTTVIRDIWSIHNLLSPNEYSSAAIGIFSCLVRPCEYEHFVKCFYQGIKMNLPIKDFLNHLDDQEKTLNNKSQVDIERCAMIARLRSYLEQNEKSFQNILNQIQIHLNQSMCENPPLPIPTSMDEFMEQCNQRNLVACHLQHIYRIRRFQYHDDNYMKQTMNIINLKMWILMHLQLFLEHISLPPISTESSKLLKTLLQNSFFIIQHPSPPVVTHSTGTKGDVTAQLNCRLLCVLDRSHPGIIIDDIVPYVYHVKTSNQIEESEIVYRQSPVNWRTYSVITNLNNTRNFLCADLTKINIGQTSIISTRQESSTGKAHYAPLIYRIDFHINVTIHLPNGLLFQETIIIQSAPFGLISNTSQEADLFPKVFIQDLISWRSSPTIFNAITTSPPKIPVSTDEILNSIRGYFIHKTGIYPKHWIMPYIENTLKTASDNKFGSMDYLCHNALVKILAQIDYMTKHPLLILFHDDGLFLGICDSDKVKESLNHLFQYCNVPISGIRFGDLSRMSEVKDIGVRVDIKEREYLSTNIKHYKIDTNKLSVELGLYVIKTASRDAINNDKILINLKTNIQEYNQKDFTNIIELVKLYHSTKLIEICPHEQGYRSIWYNFYDKENNTSSTIDQTSNNPTTTTKPYTNNINYNYQMSMFNQNQTQVYQQISPEQYNSYHPICSSYNTQTHGTFLNIPQYSIPSSTNQINTNPPVIIAVINNQNHHMISDQDIKLLVSNHLPEYFQSNSSSVVRHIDIQQLLQRTNSN